MPVVLVSNVSGPFGTCRPFQTSFQIRSEQGLLRFRTMEKTIIFPDDQDFTDDRFDELKDELLTKQKSDFSNRFKKARDKKYLIEHEYEIVDKQANEFLEVFGNILLHRFQKHYGLRSKTIREIISDFGPHTMESSEEWKTRYSEMINLGNQLKTHDPIFYENLALWLEYNPNFFEYDPSSYESCFLDLREKDGLYYFEKLAKYQAGLEYYDMICELKEGIESRSAEIEVLFENVFNNSYHSVTWTGRLEKARQIEFIKLIIALHKGGMINKGRGNIKGILNKLAPLFEIELSQNYISNLGKHLKNNKDGHDPLEIFDYLKNTFKRYMDYRS
jgi:hypothetical protein